MSLEFESPFKTADDRKAERSAKREAVLRAAATLFHRRGFHSVSLDDVAASLGIAKPTIYHHVGNKEQVLFEAADRGLRTIQDEASKAASHPGNGLERLEVCLKAYGRCVLDDYGRLVIKTTDEMLSPEGAKEFRAMKAKTGSIIRGIIKEGVADGSIADCDPVFMAFTATGSLNWMARWHKPEQHPDEEKAIDGIVSCILNGLAKRP